MDPQGQIYLGKQSIMEFHHSSFLGGQDVAAAGELEVIDGTIVFHSRKSGHYRPDQEHHDQFKSEMLDRGINLNSIHEDSIDS
jgi:hypothetical protein